MIYVNEKTGEVIRSEGHGEVVAPMTADAARDLTDVIKSSAKRTWVLLQKAHRDAAHVALGYGSWAEYCRAEFDMGRSHAYRMLDQAKVIAELSEAADMSPHGDVSPDGDTSASVDITEAAARDVKGDLPELSKRIADRTESEVDAADPEEVQTETKRRIIDEEVEKTRRTKHANQRDEARADDSRESDGAGGISAPSGDGSDDEAQAIEEHLDELPDVKRHNLRNSVLKASREMHRVMADLEPYDAAALVGPDERSTTVSALNEQIRWLTRYRDALKRSGFTVMEGGKR